MLQAVENKKTPFYYYDQGLLDATLSAASKYAHKYGFHIHYAIKANANKKILRIIANKGFGADCVSGNEIKAALDAGFCKDKIFFAGVGKTDDEIEYALREKIAALNVESLAELEVVEDIARRNQQIAPVSLRINPNVDARTHQYITTGLDENKFGIHLKDVEAALQLLQHSPHLSLVGLHFHIGSQITDMQVFRGLCIRVNEIVDRIESKGFEIRTLNMGGGLGVNYDHPDEEPVADFKRYFSVFAEHLQRHARQTVHFELGRALVAQCGTLLTRVLYIKPGRSKTFVIVDAGMNHFLRPALYQSFHKIENITCAATEKQKHYDVVGPVCETSDCFGKAVRLPETKRGDVLAIRSVGAYGEVMMSDYNLRERNPAVFD